MIKYEYKMMLSTITAVIGFAAFSLYPLNVHADDATDRYYEEKMFKEIEELQDPKVAAEVKERQRKAASELEKLRAQSQTSPATGTQSNFGNTVMPDTTNEAPDGKETPKVYKYDKKTGARVPQRLFNNVR